MQRGTQGPEGRTKQTRFFFSETCFSFSFFFPPLSQTTPKALSKPQKSRARRMYFFFVFPPLCRRRRQRKPWLRVIAPQSSSCGCHSLLPRQRSSCSKGGAARRIFVGKPRKPHADRQSPRGIRGEGLCLLPVVGDGVIGECSGTSPNAHAHRRRQPDTAKRATWRAGLCCSRGPCRPDPSHHLGNIPYPQPGDAARSAELAVKSAAVMMC